MKVVKVRITQGVRIDTGIAREGEEHDVTPALGRLIVNSGKGEYVRRQDEDDDDLDEEGGEEEEGEPGKVLTTGKAKGATGKGKTK